MAAIYWVENKDELTPLACAYSAKPGCGQNVLIRRFIALSDVCDKETAGLIRHEVSDGVIAPGYTDEALSILKEKKKGNYNVIQIDTDYCPPFT